MYNIEENQSTIPLLEMNFLLLALFDCTQLKTYLKLFFSGFYKQLDRKENQHLRNIQGVS